MLNILITGSTDGIGLQTLKKLAQMGHNVILHGRSNQKLSKACQEVLEITKKPVSFYQYDLSNLKEVEAFAINLANDFEKIDVLINNAGVFAVDNAITEENLDIRFAVNTIAPYLLTTRLIDLGLLGSGSKVLNLASAAQTKVNLNALLGKEELKLDDIAYAQSKLALTMWSIAMAEKLKDKNITVIPINPGSLLATKMVRDAYGIVGSDIDIGANILTNLALDSNLHINTGKYFDNDKQKFFVPHPDALNKDKNLTVLEVVEEILQDKLK